MIGFCCQQAASHGSTETAEKKPTEQGADDSHHQTDGFLRIVLRTGLSLDAQ